ASACSLVRWACAASCQAWRASSRPSTSAGVPRAARDCFSSSAMRSAAGTARSLRGRHHELGALGGALGPALHDRLLLGVEAHAFFAVGMHVAEQAALPAAETV